MTIRRIQIIELNNSSLRQIYEEERGHKITQAKKEYDANGLHTAILAV